MSDESLRISGDVEWLVGVDVGGTFTDAVVIRPGEETRLVKSPTRRDDPVRGLLECLDRLAEAVGIGRRQLLARTAKLAYGTTQAANMLVEDEGAVTGFITTRGFRDTLTIAGMGRDRIGQDLVASRAKGLVPRRSICEVSERIVSTGQELTPLDINDVDAAIEIFRRQGVEAIGVCLLWSFVNDVHEREVVRRLRDSGDWFVTSSAECAPLLGEYERSATTALNAKLGPPIGRHLLGVAQALKDEGLVTRPLIMTSAGGLLSLDDAAARPVSLLSSGPAGGVLASQLLAEAMGSRSILCADMGGTTFDVSLITAGLPTQQDRGVHAGHEIATAAIDIVSVGAGGGSIAWVEHGSRLKVGPRSAGANPGPACYGRGGTEATVTDANCLLGRLNPDGLAGGTLQLDRAAAERAMTRLGVQLGLAAEEVAAGILSIVDAAMADAIHGQTISRGLDPRDYTMFAYGGSGALHAATIAAEAGIPRVVVPRLAPVLSAYGVVASHLEHVLSRSVPVPIDDVATIAGALRDLEEKGNSNLDLDGIPAERRAITRSAKLRFRGQLHSVSVPLADGEVTTLSLQQTAKSFVDQYETLFGVGTASPDAGIEMLTLTVRAIGFTDRPPVEEAALVPHRPEPSGRRWAWDGAIFREVERFIGPLSPGATVIGPAVIDHPGNTVWIPPGVAATIDAAGSLVMDVAHGDSEATSGGVASHG